MSEGILGSLFAGEHTGEEPEVEAVETPVVETPVENEGPEAEIEAPEPEVEAEQAQTEDRPSKQVPLGAMLDERDRRKEAEARAKELQARLEEFERQASPQKSPYADDPYFDQFQQQMQMQLQETLFRERLDDSSERAAEKHGKEAVEAAGHWAAEQFATNPTLKAGFLSSRRPAEYLVEQHQRDQTLSAIMTDEEAYFLANAAKYGLVRADAQAQPEVEMPTAQNTTASKSPPKSLASVRGQGAATDAPKSKGGVIGSLFG